MGLTTQQGPGYTDSEPPLQRGEVRRPHHHGHQPMHKMQKDLRTRKVLKYPP
jgi:hypothetical protein